MVLYENELDGIEYIWLGLGIEHMTVIIIKNAVEKYPFDNDLCPVLHSFYSAPCVTPPIVQSYTHLGIKMCWC